MSIDSKFNGLAFRSSIADRDARSLARQLALASFVLIHIQESGDSDDELGALTADVNDEPYLVAFTSQRHATAFVDHRRDLFAGDDEVGGFVVDGEVVLDYLGEAYGLLVNPEGEDGCLIDRLLIEEVLDEFDLE